MHSLWLPINTPWHLNKKFHLSSRNKRGPLEVPAGLKFCHKFKKSGGGDGNRTHVRSITYSGRYMLSLRIYSYTPQRHSIYKSQFSNTNQLQNQIIYLKSPLFLIRVSSTKRPFSLTRVKWITRKLLQPVRQFLYQKRMNRLHVLFLNVFFTSSHTKLDMLPKYTIPRRSQYAPVAFFKDQFIWYSISVYCL